MPTETTTLAKAPYEMPPTLAQGWQDWFRTHGINPSSIPVGSTITRDEENNRITYRVFAVDDRGQCFFTPDGEPETCDLTVDLARPPAAFPTPTEEERVRMQIADAIGRIRQTGPHIDWHTGWQVRELACQIALGRYEEPKPEAAPDTAADRAGQGET